MQVSNINLIIDTLKINDFGLKVFVLCALEHF